MLNPLVCLDFYTILRTPPSFNQFLENLTPASKMAKPCFSLFDAGFHVCEHPRGFGRSSQCSQNSSLIGNLQTNVGRMASWRVRWFQSLIGNLQTGGEILEIPPTSMFQSLIGNLQTNKKGKSPSNKKGFNPS